MALNTHIALAARKASLDAGLNLANSGTLVIYDGVQPADADTAVTTQNVLATIALAATAFNAAAGSASAPSTKGLVLPATVTASRTGVAAWYRIWESNGTTAVADGSVGTGTNDLVVGTTAFQTGASTFLTGTNQYAMSN